MRPMRPQYSFLIQALPGDASEGAAALLGRLRFLLTREDVECRALANGAPQAVTDLLRAEGDIRQVAAWAGGDESEGWAALIEAARGQIVILLRADALLPHDPAWVDWAGAMLRRNGVGAVALWGAQVLPGWRGVLPLPAAPGPCDLALGGMIAVRQEAALSLPEDTPNPVLAGPIWARKAGWEAICLYACLYTPCDGPLLPDADRLAALREVWGGQGLIAAECW